MMEICARFRDMSDREYVTAVLGNVQDAVACFIEEFLEEVCRKVISKYPALKNKETPEGLAHDFYLYLAERDWRVLRNFQYRAKLSTYMHSIISHFVNDNYRADLAKIILSQIVYSNEDEDEEIDMIEFAADTRPGPEKVLIQKDMERFLYEDILGPNGKAGLNDIEKKIVRLKHLAYISSLEIGSILGMTVSNVDTTASRAREKIGKYCKAEGLTLGDFIDS